MPEKEGKEGNSPQDSCQYSKIPELYPLLFSLDI
jgi:hypothetical protein